MSTWTIPFLITLIVGFSSVPYLWFVVPKMDFTRVGFWFAAPGVWALMGWVLISTIFNILCLPEIHEPEQNTFNEQESTSCEQITAA